MQRVGSSGSAEGRGVRTPGCVAGGFAELAQLKTEASMALFTQQCRAVDELTTRSLDSLPTQDQEIDRYIDEVTADLDNGGWLEVLARQSTDGSAERTWTSSSGRRSVLPADVQFIPVAPSEHGEHEERVNKPKKASMGFGFVRSVLSAARSVSRSRSRPTTESDALEDAVARTSTEGSGRLSRAAGALAGVFRTRGRGPWRVAPDGAESSASER